MSKRPSDAAEKAKRDDDQGGEWGGQAASRTEESTAGPHADKYNDPRARITGRGVAIAIGITLLAILGAAGSIYARKTRLGESTRFWGEETITALQLGERIMLLPRSGEQFEPVDLTGTPGLGHLRRALLDERHYAWQSESAEPALADCKAESDSPPRCIQLKITDPTAHRFETVRIDLDLDRGWVGPSGEGRRVRFSEHAAPKLRNYFATIINVETRRYDLRD